MMARLVLCHLPRQEMTGNSLSKLVDPALEPYFKPLDYVITLADIEEAAGFAVTVHEKLVYAAWLQCEKRDKDLNDDGSSTYCSGRKLECLDSAMAPSFAPWLPSDACSCHSSTMDPCSSICGSAPVSSRVSNGIAFHIDGDIVQCNNQKNGGSFHSIL
ncbi:unnamed protein product [Sphagnum troendelagicum]|uniref:Uncharacterized protein n=1 Tax=Sphagnum troendelagicum TaxID=128251 RepID=A0ABP0TRS4_9BRYO